MVYGCVWLHHHYQSSSCCCVFSAHAYFTGSILLVSWDNNLVQKSWNLTAKMSLRGRAGKQSERNISTFLTLSNNLYFLSKHLEIVGDLLFLHWFCSDEVLILPWTKTRNNYSTQIAYILWVTLCLVFSSCFIYFQVSSKLPKSGMIWFVIWKNVSR